MHASRWFGLGVTLLVGCGEVEHNPVAGSGGSVTAGGAGGNITASGAGGVASRGDAAGGSTSVSLGSGGASGSGGLDAAGGAVSGPMGGAVGAGGSFNTWNLVTDPARIAGRSFEMAPKNCVIAPSSKIDSSAEVLASQVDCRRWVFHFAADSSGGLVFVGYGDALAEAPLSLDGTTWSTLEGAPTVPLAAAPPVSAKLLLFQFVDRDGDEYPDIVQVVGSAVVSEQSDDYSFDYAVAVEAQGTLDVHAPTLPAEILVNAFSYPSFAASEPLALDAHATLTLADGREIALGTTHTTRLVTEFHLRELLLPLSSARLRVEGADLAGNVISQESTVRVESIPAEASPDFESAAPFALVGQDAPYPNESGARTSYQGLPALEGEHSFLVSFGSNVLLHFRRPANAQNMSVAVRPVFNQPEEWATFEAMVAGGSIGASFLPFDQLPSEALFEDWRVAPVQRLQFKLNGSGEDVLLRVHAPAYEASVSSATALWIDDVRFE